MSTVMNQSSAFSPAVCFHKGLFHAVFVANNTSRQLLHVTSRDGVNWNDVHLNNVRQSSNNAPALADVNGTMVVVFIANNGGNELLLCRYEDNVDNWSDNVDLHESTPAPPTLVSENGRLTMCFVANNGGHELLAKDVTSFIQ
jgi:hypothetical protein